MNDLQHRVNDWLSGRPETQAVRDYYLSVEVFGFDHAATRGCLLALVREGHGDEAQPETHSDGGWVFRHGPWCLTYALVSALESAPTLAPAQPATLQ